MLNGISPHHLLNLDTPISLKPYDQKISNNSIAKMKLEEKLSPTNFTCEIGADFQTEVGAYSVKLFSMRFVN